MLLLPLAVALLPQYRETAANGIEDELNEARVQLQQIQQDDFKPLQQLVSTAHAEETQASHVSSLLQEDPDAVDANGDTDADRLLKQEQTNIDKLANSINTEWSSFGKKWRAAPHGPHPDEPKDEPSSFAETGKKASPELTNFVFSHSGIKDELAASYHELINFVSAQKSQAAQLLALKKPTSFAETSSNDVTGLERIQSSLAGIEAKLRKEAAKLGGPSSFAQLVDTSDPPHTLDAGSIVDSLSEMHAHIAKEQNELQDTFAAAPGMGDDALDLGAIPTGAAGRKLVAEKKQEVAQLEASMKARADRLKKQMAASRDIYRQMRDLNRDDARELHASSFLETEPDGKFQWLDAHKKEDFEKNEADLDANEGKLKKEMETMKAAHAKIQAEMAETRARMTGHKHSPAFAEMKASAEKAMKEMERHASDNLRQEEGA